MFLLIDVIVWDINIKLQAQILKLYALQTTDWTTFFKGHLDWKCKWNSAAVCPGEASCSKLGLVQKFEFRYERLKSKFSLIFLSTIWLLDIPKIKRGNYTRKYFWLAGVKFNPG